LRILPKSCFACGAIFGSIPSDVTGARRMAGQVVLLGGSFDPVHNGHLIVARAVAEECGFGRVWLVPAASPPHKPPTRASGEHRLAMLRLAIEDEDLFDVCDVELRRKGPSYTLETLRTLRLERGPDVELVWIIGADMLAGLANWHHADRVLDMARIVIAARPPWTDRMDEILTGMAGHLRADHVSRLRGSVVETPLVDLSSSEVRRRVSAGRSIRYMVPESVNAYIRKNKLYVPN